MSGTLYKVIGVDNYARENVSDVLVAGAWGMTKEDAETVATLLNKYGERTYFKAVPNNYQLYRFEP